ncbi:MAG: aminotransferase class V-fold PLP-dependent enzyme [Microscillaceae bacterium]|nr:aminotransferase class V-fold PLP-dependent enzyme [Microscillaceae bacterium]
MSLNRRNFIQQSGKMTASWLTIPLLNTPALANKPWQLTDYQGLDVTQNEDFWHLIRQAYTVSPNVINLNNGGVSPQPLVVQDALDRYNRYANEAPTYYMWQVMDQNREPLREKLADLAGCSPEELAINRNATEALDTVIFGLSLQKGDEVVLTKQDYPNMINAWKQRETRDGIRLKWINLELPLENDDLIVRQFTEQFTPRTKVVHITHIINWTGQILPVRKIADEARRRGIEVLVDAAHTFAHLDYKIYDLGADYWGTSLHKWLSAPFGTGLLWVKKEKIKALYPLIPHHEPQSDNIRKFEALGTRSFPTEMATGQALDFHNMIGTKRKQDRLHYLKNYWVEKCLQFPNFKINTSLKPEYACAIAHFSIQGMKSEDISARLFNQFKIHTVAINWENISGVRVTPHVYTSLKDLDKLVKAIQSLCNETIKAK